MNKNYISKSSMLPGTERTMREEAPGDNVAKNWPDSLDKYVKRCFALATTQAQQVWRHKGLNLPNLCET